ncbi:ABC transporter permease [Cohnella luojiensis]|uniref:ABC transporter permease n=1 Tax=Cohnella luojiensis TaxID=652876 RepID=A0A4Y8M7R6_9BACL|nr:FtsX-like permease family protein [Cohnella luojiensis]TFE31852.1 ABC transporter permease [Cohnella luojiensis]
MWQLAYKNLKFRITRSLLTILGILAAIQLYVMMSNIMGYFDHETQRQISGMAGRIVVEDKSENNSYPPLNTVIEEKSVGQILQIPGVDLSRSSTLLFQTLVPAPGPGMPPSVLAVGVEPGKENVYLGNYEVRGDTSLAGINNAILGLKAAEYYGVQIGDSISLRDYKLTVTGIVEDADWLIDGSILIPLKTSQEIFTRPSLISAVLVTAAKADEAKSISEQISAIHPKLRVSSSEELAQNAEKLLKSTRTFFTMINSTAIVIAIVVVTIVMVMAIFERRKEIGTLKAIGATKRKIIGIIMAESLTISLIGGITALPVSFILNGLMFGEWVLNPGKWIETLVVSALVGILASLWPAWAAQRVNPLESLRYE